jgi:hypothetical protein
MMSASDASESLNDKLDTLIRIQAALAIKDIPNQKDKIAFLYGAGLAPNSIASILGAKSSSIRSTMAKHKKASASKGDSSDE